MKYVAYIVNIKDLIRTDTVNGNYSDTYHSKSNHHLHRKHHSYHDYDPFPAS